MIDWNHSRIHRYSPDPAPDEWPKGVRPISIEGVSLLGVHESDGKLYWDGHEIVTKINIGWLPILVAGFAAAGTFGSFVLKLGELRHWW